MGLQNILNIEPGSIIWTIVSFLIIVWLIGKFGWKPLLKGLKSREDSIRGDIDQARTEREQAARLLEDYKSAMAGARKESAEVITKAQEEAVKAREKGEAETREVTQQMIEKARTEITRESDAAKAELNRHVAELTARATSKLLGRTISAADHERLILDSLKDDA